MDEYVIATLREMAWERAKGELSAYLRTYWPKYDRSGKEIDQGFDAAETRITAFIKDFEDNVP